MKVNTALEQVHGTITAPYPQEFENLQKDLKSADEYLQGLLGMNLASLQQVERGCQLQRGWLVFRP